MNDNKRKLYDALSQEYDMGTFEQFSTDIEDEAKRRKLYEAIKGTYDLPDFNGFSSQLGIVATQPQQTEQKQTEQKQELKNVADTVVKPVVPTFTEQQIDSMERTPMASDTVLQQGEQFRQAADQMGSRAAEDEEVVRAKQGLLRDQMGNTLPEIEQRLDSTYNAAVERAREATTPKSGVAKFVHDIFMPNPDKPLSGMFNRGVEHDIARRDPEVQALTTAKKYMDDSRSMIAAADRGDENFFKGAARGFGEKFMDLSTWDFGITELENNKTLRAALDKADNGEELTDAERSLLDAAAVKTATDMYFGSYLSRGYKAGSVTAESIPFMIEMAANPLSATGKTAASKMLRYTINRFGRKAATSGLGKAGLTVARGVGDIAGAAGMSATTGAVRVAADAERRQMGDVQFDENPDADRSAVFTYGWHTEGDDYADAWRKAFLGTTIENYSEMVGAYFAPALNIAGKGARKGIDKIGLKKVNEFVDNVSGSDLGRLVSDFESRTQWNGTIGEYAEEVAGGIMNALLVGDQTLDTDERTGVFNLDNNIDTFLGVSLMGGFFSAIKTAGYRTPKYRARQDMKAKDDAAAAAFGNQEKWGEIRNTIAFGTDEDVEQKVKDIVNDADLTPEQRQAALEYVKAAEMYKGMLKGEEIRRADADPLQVDAETSFDNGYGLSGVQERNDAKNMLDYQRQKAVDTFGEIKGLDEDPIATLQTMRDGGYTPEQLQVAIDYVNAKATYDGMIQHVRDDIDGRIATSDALIESRQHHDDGMIHPATMKTDDRKVYVIVGKLVMNEDGSGIDREASRAANGGDGMILVRDAASGDIMPASVEDFLSADEAIDADQEKQTAQEAIRQQYAQEAANKIDGVLPFNNGDAYQIMDEQGQQHTVTVIPTGTVNSQGQVLQAGDGEVVVSIDGAEPVPMSREAIQQMFDNANLARLQQFEQEQAAHREEQAAAEREANRPVYNINDEVTLQTEEGTVRGSITAEANEDGLIEVYTEQPIGGKKINLYNRDQLDGMVVEHNGAQQPVETPAAEPQVTVTQQTDGDTQLPPLTDEGIDAMLGDSPAVTEAQQPTGEAAVTNVDEPMPMVGQGEDAEPDFSQATPQRAHTYIYNEAGLSRDEANQFVEANKKAADKELEKVQGKKPKMGTSLAKYRKETAEWQQNVEAAQQQADYWKQVKDEQAKIVAAERAAQSESDAGLHDQAVIDEQARQAEELRKREEQAALGTHNVAPAIREKWESAHKVEGARNEIVLANGERVPGRYILVESGAATPSHNPRAEFTKNEGFPVDANGQSVNDRDYERDKDAQQTTRQIASVYDQRALQSPVVVSQDGVVLSGNGRTMAGELAAQNDTDGAYIEHLKKYGQQFGFTSEQVEGMQHPRVLFVPDEAMPYTTDTFAKFNAQEMKGQSKTEQAVKLGKVVDDNTFGRIIRSINSFDTLGEFYNDPKAATEAINELRNAGAISQAQYAEMFDGETISAQGREVLENTLIGKAFESNPDAVRQLTEIKSLRQSVINALAEVVTNMQLGKDYTLESELAQAIDLAYKARKSGYKDGERVSGFARQLNLFPFDEGETIADYNNATVLMLADVMNDSRTNQLKKSLAIYNHHAADSAAGQMDIFSGGVQSKEDIIKEVLNILNYGTEQEQQQSLAAAVEQRKTAAAEQPSGGSDGVQQDGTLGNGDNTGEAVVEQPQPVSEPAETEEPSPLAVAEQETDTNPTPAQKEAGNYKKGHVKIDGYDISIENPKGSIRHGRAHDGTEWERRMNNTYGYIRGTEGVDGDHIDVFLSDNPESGNVYVIDQRNADGSFDEHKVMYGFNSADEARAAYLSNYEEGWQGLGAITEVSKDEFKKWVNSSHRKTKPFAEYKSVKPLGGQNESSYHVGEQFDIVDDNDKQDVEAVPQHTGQASGDVAESYEVSDKEFDDILGELDDIFNGGASMMDFFDDNWGKGERQDIGVAMDGETTLDHVRELFDRFNTGEHSAELKALAHKVFALVKNLNLREITFSNDNEFNFGQQGLYASSVIRYRHNYFTHPDISNENKAHVLLHELIHACTMYAIRDYEKGGNHLSEDMKDAVKTLVDVYEQIKDDGSFKGEYGISDVKEMVAELSSPQFRAKMQAKKLWKKVVGAIKQLFGIKTEGSKETSAFSEASSALDYLLDNFDGEAYYLYSGRRATMGQKNTAVNESTGQSGADTRSGSVGRSASHSPAATLSVSFDAAKVRNFTQKAKRNIKNFLNGDNKISSEGHVNQVLGNLRRFFGMSYAGNSNYVVYDTPAGRLAFRLANHNARGDNFKRDNAQKNISVYVALEDYEQPGSSIPFTEYRISQEDFERHKDEFISSLVESVGNALNTGEFTQPSYTTKEEYGPEESTPFHEDDFFANYIELTPEQKAKVQTLGTRAAMAMIERGTTKFEDFAKAMVDRLGDNILPFLKSFYNGARDFPGFEDYELTPYEDVRRFDVLSLSRKSTEQATPTVFEKAEEVTKELEVERQAEEASERIREIAEKGSKSEQKRGKATPSKKKSVSLQQEPDLFGSFGEDATHVESLNDNSNGHARTDAVRSEGLPADGTDSGELGLRADGKGAGQESGRTDRRGAQGGVEPVRQRLHDGLRPSEQLASTPSAKPQGARQPLERPNNPKNTHNNHAERGKDYAPRGVDARIDANIKAIELMKQLMETGEQATPEQMKVLRQFSGWGGLGKAFNPDGYQGGYRPDGTPARLRALLGEEAYQQANMSRNSAYYTPANVIDALWDVARAMGFNGGRVLEGSAGIGNIIGLMPTYMSERSDIHAVEIDGTTGNILSLLYPDAKVDVQGFEATQVENGSVDLAITNVPFVPGMLVPKDTSGDSDLSRKFRNSIQDFCIAKNVRKLREGGIGIFITSRSTLDDSARLREWVIQEGGADVVGAFRLNNETFGGTGATSDIIVIRKRVNGKKSPHAIDVLTTTGERIAEYDTGETKKVKGEEIPIIKQLSMDYNSYFVEHPEMMGGEMHFNFEMGETRYPTSRSLFPVKGKNQADMLKSWSQSFEGKDWGEVATVSQHTGQATYEELGEGVKEGSMVVSNGQLCIAQRGKAVPLAVNANKVKGHSKVECFEAYQGIKKALSDLLQYQTDVEDDSGLQPLLKALNKAYDDFVKTYGHLHKNTSISFLKSDVDFANILALEKFSERGDVKTGKRIQEFGKTDIFSQRVVEKEKAPEPTNVKDGIIASIYVHGRVDIPWMAATLSQHTGHAMTEEQIKAEIVKSGLGFENPVTRQMEVSYEYLSGNVREKLAQAQANNADGQYDANIKALEKVVPMDIPAHLIDFSIGSSWIDPKLYEEYVKEKTDIDVTFTSAGGTWFMRTPYSVGEQKNRAMGVVSELLHKTIMGTQLIEAAMQNKTITVSETHKKWDGSIETITDKEATQACSNKIDEIRQDFKEWARAKMQSDSAMSEHIERIYNDMFNNYVPRTIPDEFVPAHFGGAATTVDGKPFSLRPHQGKAVIRGTMQPLLLAHEVGSGKTYTLISTAMEMRRLGTARKPMIVVQNATVGQFVESAKKLYPNAKVLTLEDKDHTGEGRKNFYAKIKYNDWDMIVVPQSVFERIPDSEERQMKFVQDKIEEKMLVLEQMRDADPDSNSWIVKQAEKEIDKLEDELAGLTDSISSKRKERDEKKEAVTRQNAEVKALEMLDRQTDDVENFDDMGIDAILVDEAHEYKHLGFATAMQRGVKGVDPSYSKKAQGVYLKTQAVLEKNNGRNVVFATGTPISNTAAEIWTFMRYLMPADTMKEYGIYYFDDFVRNFGNLQQMLEFTTSGKFKEVNRFAGYVNLPELVRIWAGVADTVLNEDVEKQRIAEGGESKIPEMEGGKATDIYLPQTRALRSVMKYVKKQLDDFDKMSGKDKKANSHIPLTMYGIAKAAAVDARLVVSDAADEPQSKTNEAVRQTLRSLRETESYSGTVALFADNYQNKRSGFNLYEDIREKLIAQGVPAEQIVVMKSGMSVKKKLEIFDKVNRGEVRVIMGSTFTLGTGVNIQERLHTLIHLDAPNRPMDYTQRNGRILRQGNLHKEMGKPVRVLRFGVEDSLDVTAYQRLKTKGAIADSIMNGKHMMSNSMENRALEEEEDVFGDTVAQLSGSEYAMLKNQAEKDVRKYEAKKKQYQADQTYCHNEIPRLEGEIKTWKERLDKYRKNLEMVEALPQHTEPSITVGKQAFPSIEAMADFIKEYNKSIKEAENDLRDNPSLHSQTRRLTVNVGGIDFVFTTEQNVETKEDQGTLFSAVRRKMTYSCEALGLADVPVHQSLLREGLEDIVNNVISGQDFRDGIERSERIIEKNEKSLAQVRERHGKPFEFEKELKQAHERFDEYSELMKKELEEKEKKYAEMDADVEEASDISEAEEEAEEETEDDGVRFRDDDDAIVTNDEEEGDVRFREVSDEGTIEWLEDQPTVKVYRSMVLIDGKLYPPMSSKEADGKQLRQPSELGKWEESEEAPEKAVKRNGKWYFPLRKDNGKMLYAAYNPYIHTSRTMLNDQFSEAAESTVERLGLGGRVTIMENADGLKGRKAKAKGWFDAKTGKIVVVLGNHHSVSDVVKTILHEGVAHYGLRKLFGQHFDQFLDNVYQYGDESVRREIVELAKKHGWDFRVATEEYLARLAEDTDFEGAFYQGWWSKIKSLFLDMLHHIGLGDYGGAILTNNELRYILWRSYENMAEPGLYRNPFREAEDISMQMRLGVGSFDRERARIHSLGRIDSSRQIAAEGVAEGDGKVLFRDGDFSERDRAIARDRYEEMVSSGLYQFQEAVQDSMLGLKKLYDAILSPKGKVHMEDVEGYENAYLAENRMSSVNAAEQHDYYLRFMQPLLMAIGSIAGNKKGARQALTDYMMAKHGLERNRVFAERDAREVEANGGDFNDAYQKFREKDYSGLTALTGEDDVAAAEAAAQQIVDDYEAAYDTADLWDRTREATQATLEKIYRSGLLSKERYEQIRDMFEYYIPLQGWDETTSDEVYGYLTSKSGPFGGSPIKHAAGRSSKADDPIATIAMMADAAIRQGNRNLMKQRFLNFVLNHPSDLVSVHDLWLQYDAATDEWIPVFADLEDGDTAADVERKVEAFEQRMEQLAEAEPDRYKRGREAQGIPYKVVKGNLKEHQVLVKRGGRTYVLTINGNPRAAQALNGLTNPDVEQGGVVGNMLKAGEWVNRKLSAFYTTRNPDFVVSNFFRDMLYSNCMTWVKESPRYALRYHKNFGMVANPVMMRRLLGKWEHGTLDRNKRLEEMFYQFMMNGGETGYTSVRDIEEHKREIAKELKKQGSLSRKAWSALGMQLDLLNRSVENCARFAAFVTSREMGRSIDRSIYDAKEVSVNFNKKGSGGKMVNATGQTLLGKVGSYVGGGGRLAYVFWNAGVQGLTNFGRAGKRHGGKAFAGAATMFILGYVIPQLAAAMGGGDGDDDDKNAYYNLPEYVRRSNICFRVGDQWVTIPLPIEFRSIYGLGELASGAISGNEHYDNKELSYQIASQVSQILPLDMLEGGGGVSPWVPSSAKPFVEAYVMNKGWTGLPIYKDTPWNQNDPEWTKAYKNADQSLVGASKWLNEKTGGDDFKKGAIDINPAKLEYLLSGVFGGYVNTAEKLKKMGETALGDREFDWRNMLLANRVVKTGDERTANRKLQNEYFKYKKEYDETKRLLRKYENGMDEGIAGMAEKVNFLYNSPEYFRYELFDEYKADIDDYREDLQEATDDAERKSIEAEMYARMRELIDQLHEIK